MIPFYKYHGAGNDFILLNCLEKPIHLSKTQIEQLCDRHKGIGADGLMYLLPSEKYDFEMKYFNSDGGEGTMCGNGGRCIISFAFDMGFKKDSYSFLAIDGSHKGRILNKSHQEKIIELQMNNVEIEKGDIKLIDTGSPHYLKFVDEVESMDVFAEGKSIRNSASFIKEGVNVNFIREDGNNLFVRTYERGVEDETLACGTGVTAAAIASSIRQGLQFKKFDIQTLGGELKVSFDSLDSRNFTNVMLTGPAAFVFKGSINI